MPCLMLLTQLFLPGPSFVPFCLSLLLCLGICLGICISCPLRPSSSPSVCPSVCHPFLSSHLPLFPTTTPASKLHLTQRSATVGLGRGQAVAGVCSSLCVLPLFACLCLPLGISLETVSASHGCSFLTRVSPAHSLPLPGLHLVPFLSFETKSDEAQANLVYYIAKDNLELLLFLLLHLTHEHYRQALAAL